MKTNQYMLAILVALVVVIALTFPNFHQTAGASRQRECCDVNLVHSQSPKVVPPPIKHSDEMLLRQVSERLLAVAREHPANVQWPPSISLVSSGELDAYAALRLDEKRNERVDRQGKFIPYIAIDQILMDELTQGSADRLAVLVGHELSHIILGHVLPTSPARRARTATLKIVFTSEQEHDADINGMKLVVAAGYNYKAFREIWEALSSRAFAARHPSFEYSSFEAVAADHPSWSDRLSYVDNEKANVWKAMSAFNNGSTFLYIQQYPAAEEAFLRVVDEFPDSYEGWANLGYARLMMYLDALDAEDLKRYAIGQLVVGSFYVRPEELRAKVRGVNANMWQSAVDALEKAVELNPDLSLAKANLGVAHLLNPNGKDAKTAQELLQQALANPGKNVYRYNLAAVAINLAVASLASGQYDLSSAQLDFAQSLVGDDAALAGAIDYNRALLLIAQDTGGVQNDQRRLASSLLVKFLRTTSSASAWWDLGYDKYIQLMKKLGVEPESRAALAASAKVSLRPITSVELSQGVLVTLSDRSEVVKSKVKPLTAVPVVGSSIELLHHEPSGSDLLVGRRVVAVYLHGPNAPTLKLQSLGTPSRTVALTIGLSQNEVEQLIGKDRVLAPVGNPDVSYYFYPDLGVAVHYDREKKVDELVLAQIAIVRS